MKQVLFLILILSSVILFSQMTHQEYIEKYKDIAVAEMKRSGVPASITLAQGIFESSSGNSRLATEGNNHFGIKCNNKWTGEGIYEDDDKPNECFRKYKNDADSYKDHSDFLTSSTRYSFLFDYDITDYKSWAKGLKKAGYATSPTYADKLIELIERYNLYQYDKLYDMEPIAAYNSANDRDLFPESQATNRHVVNNNEFIVTMEQRHIGRHEIFVFNGLDYIILDKNTDLKTIAKETNMFRFEIRNFNDLGSRKQLAKDEIIYLTWKKNTANKNNKIHVVGANETLQYISQLYGIKLKSLCKKNNISKETSPPIGTKLKL